MASAIYLPALYAGMQMETNGEFILLLSMLL